MNDPSTNPASQLSIITAVFNGATHLESCLESVARQRGASIQHIVIDGGSTDGSVDILRRYSGQIDRWISEPDDGIADAMNKGIRLAKGEWILFLHSDDELLSPDGIAQVLGQLMHTEARVAAFPIRHGQPEASRLIRPRGATPWLRFRNGLPHQGVFIHRSVFDEIGLHDKAYRISMDYDFFLRAWLKGVAFTTFTSPVPTLMRDTGISSRTDWPGLQQRLMEERRIHSTHGSSRSWKVAYSIYWTLYPAYRKARLVIQRMMSRRQGNPRPA